MRRKHQTKSPGYRRLWNHTDHWKQEFVSLIFLNEQKMRSKERRTNALVELMALILLDSIAGCCVKIPAWTMLRNIVPVFFSTVVIRPFCVLECTFCNSICTFRCKTSLLFQAAVTHAAQGHHVVFISHEPISRLPLHVHGMPSPDANLLKELKMLCVHELMPKICSEKTVKTAW